MTWERAETLPPSGEYASMKSPTLRSPVNVRSMRLAQRAPSSSEISPTKQMKSTSCATRPIAMEPQSLVSTTSGSTAVAANVPEYGLTKRLTDARFDS